jgi:hypothetical protein
MYTETDFIIDVISELRDYTNLTDNFADERAIYHAKSDKVDSDLNPQSEFDLYASVMVPSMNRSEGNFDTKNTYRVQVNLTGEEPWRRDKDEQTDTNANLEMRMIMDCFADILDRANYQSVNAIPLSSSRRSIVENPDSSLELVQDWTVQITQTRKVNR